MRVRLKTVFSINKAVLEMKYVKLSCGKRNHLNETGMIDKDRKLQKCAPRMAAGMLDFYRGSDVRPRSKAVRNLISGPHGHKRSLLAILNCLPLCCFLPLFGFVFLLTPTAIVISTSQFIIKTTAEPDDPLTDGARPRTSSRTCDFMAPSLLGLALDKRQ